MSSPQDPAQDTMTLSRDDGIRPIGSTLVNRNVTVRGRRTSVRLEPAMWDALDEICRREHRMLGQIVTAIEASRTESSLTAAIRVFIMDYFRRAATERGHRQAGHGVFGRDL